MPACAALPTSGYRGRFAPSPSGPLHAGSLVAALGSYLDARAHNGQWLLRIEDIDPPREVPGAANIILQQLSAHGLHWDEAVSWQSQHHQRYQAVLNALEQQQLTYFCTCSRAQIKARGEHYDGYCRTRKRSASQAAVRLCNHHPTYQFNDQRHGLVTVPAALASEDFMLRRRDQLWAYQLAVVVDDMASGITHIVRGEDLLHASAWQLTLWQQLKPLSLATKLPLAELPTLHHLPLVVAADGRKLSKQNHAPALENQHAADNLATAAAALGLTVAHPNEYTNLERFLQAATQAWQQQVLQIK